MVPSVLGALGYQVVLSLFFLLTLPINIAINAAAASTVAVICAGKVPDPTPKPSPATTSAAAPAGGGGAPAVAESASTATATDTPDSKSSTSSSSKAGLTPDELEHLAKSSSPSSRPSDVPEAKAKAKACSPITLFTGWGKRGAVIFHEDLLRGRTTAPSSWVSKSSSSGSSSRSNSPESAERAMASFSRVEQGRSGVAAFRPSSKVAKKRPFDLPAALPPKPGLKERVQRGWGKAATGWGMVKSEFGRVWTTDLLVNVWSLPLQALSLAVIPVYWTFPKLLGIQLTVPATILREGEEKVKGQAALKVSEEMMAGYRAAYAWPYVALIGLGRLVEGLKQLVLVAVPVRWWQDVIEIPMLIIAAFTVLRLLVYRLQDLLPLTAYLIRAKKEGVQGGEKVAVP